MTELGHKIKEARKRKGISQEELAELTQVNLRTIQRIENNESKPRAKTVSLICNALDINTLEVIDDENKIDKKRLVIPIILTLIIILSTFLSWFSYEAASTGNIMTAYGWNGKASYRGIIIYNWLVSLSAISVGFILILALFNVIKKHFMFIIPQLIIILAYILFYTNVSTQYKSVRLSYGLFLVISSVIGLTILYYNMESKKENNVI